MDIFGYRSRYRTTEMVVVDGLETVGFWRQPSYIEKRPDESLINNFYVNSALEARPDLIAQRFYGSPELDWVVIAFNNPSEILNWPRAGDIIEIVDPGLVYAEL